MKVFVEGVGEIQLPVNGVSTGSLPMASSLADVRLIEQTIGPLEHTQDGVKWSPLREILETHGCFHG